MSEGGIELGRCLTGELYFGCENERKSRDRKASPAKRIFAPSGSNGQALLRWELPETGPWAIFPADVGHVSFGAKVVFGHGSENVV
jgi:hypothetical protein